MYQEYVIYYITLLGNCWLWSIVLHELGHVLYYKRLTGCWPRVWLENWAINVGTDNQLRKLKSSERREFYLIGTFAGLIPYIWCPVPAVAFIGVIPYALGCKWDLGKFIK
jgi:hypothetical protein